MARKATKRKVERKIAKGTLWLYSAQITAPISGELRERRVYALAHVVFRNSFGKATVDINRSLVHAWSGTKTLAQMAVEARADGYEVKLV